MATVSEIIFKMVVDASGINSGTKSVESSLSQVESRTKTFGQALESVGSRMTNVGTNIAVPFTAATAGIGTALASSVKQAMSFEAQMDRVGAISQASGAEMEKLTNQALKLGAETSKSAGEVAIGMENLAAMGFEVNDIMGAMPGVISAAEASGADMAQVADVMASSMNAFGLEATEATHIADVLAQTANQSAADITDLQYSFKYAAPVAKMLGMSMEELAAATGIMADNGIKGEQAGTTLRAALLRLSDPPKDASNALAELGVQITDAQGNMLPFSNIIGQLAEKTDGMSNAQKAATLSTIFGTEAVSGMLAVIEAGPEKIDRLTQGLIDSDGASAKAAAQMKDNLAGALEELGGEIETLQINIGNALIPIIQKAAGVLQSLGEWFNNLSPPMQQFISVGTLVVGAITGIIAIFGTFIAIIGSAVSAIGALIPLLPSLGTVIAAVTGPVGLTVAAITGLIAIGVALYKNWDEITEKVGPLGTAILSITNPIFAVVNAIKLFQEAHEPAIQANLDFSNAVSKTTQEAVQSYLDLDSDATVALNQLSWSHTTVTQKMVDDLVTIYDSMSEQILSSMQKRQADELAEIETFFNQNSTLTAEREAQILQQRQQYNEQQTQAVRDGSKRINEILQIAADEKRGITQAEADEIAKIQEGMRNTAVQVLSENEREQKVILERLKQEASAITAEQAAQVVQNSVKQRDEVIKEANQQYEDTVAMAIKMRDETGEISAEEAQLIIDEAKRKRDETVKHTEDMHQNVVDQAKKQASEHINEIDWETGEILNKWQAFKNNVGATWDGIVSSASEKWSNLKSSTAQTWENIKSDMSSKMENAKTAVTNAFENIRSNASSKLTSAKDAATNAFETLRKNLADKSESARKTVADKFEAARKAMVQPVEKARDSIKSVIDKIAGFFNNLKLKIPQPSLPKLPTFKLKTSTTTILGKEITYPTGFDIKWAQRGGIFDTPTILGVGEAGAEAVVPLVGRRMDPFADAVFNRLEERMALGNQGLPSQEVHNHYWNVDADQISDVQKLIDIVNGVVQTVRSK